MNIAVQLEKIIKPNDCYEIGYANVEGCLKPELINYKYAISFVRRLEDHIIDKVNSGPTRPYLNQYHRVNNELTTNISNVSSFLTKKGIVNLPISPTNEGNELTEYEKVTMRLPFSHKMAATRAGLGWIGKTDLLITQKYGPRVRLATILLENKIGETGTPIIKSRCGECNICVLRCPAQAANGKIWDTATDRDLFYDPFKCRNMCRILSKKNINEDISLCGICVSVCPKGRNGGIGK